MFRTIDRLFFLLVFMPPAYMLYRFVKWYVRDDQREESAEAES